MLGAVVYWPLKLQPAIYSVPNDLGPSDAQSYCKTSPAWKINCSLTTGFWAFCRVPEDLWFTMLCIWASQEGQSGEIDFVPPVKMNVDTLHGTSQCAAGSPGWLCLVGKVTMDLDLKFVDDTQM